MQKNKTFEKIHMWINVFERIRFFRQMYPLKTILKDVFLFPLDYYLMHRPVTSVRNLTIATTHRCNLRCKMCYFHEKLKSSQSLPLESFRHVIDAVAKSRPCIILSGGEPFLHPDLLSMVDYAKKKKLAVQIFTNGTLVRPEKVHALTKMGLNYIDFSLLGKERIHSEIAGVPNAYEKFMENLAYFSKHRGHTKIVLNYTITPESVEGLYHAVEIARQYQLDGLRIQHYNYLLPSEFKAQECVMANIFGQNPGVHEIDEVKGFPHMFDALKAVKDHISQKMPDIPVQWAPGLTDAEIKHWYSGEPFVSERKCLYPWRGMLLDADGSLYPCSKIYLKLGNVTDEDVFDIWNNKQMEVFRGHLKTNLFPACSRCCKL